MAEDFDGFKVFFEKDCSPKDQKFFRFKYPNVDNVANERVHCTSCDCHIGTAPSAAKRFRTHPVLGVTQCNDCFNTKYQKDPLSCALPPDETGPDGSEFFCKWCGDGGELLCCSECTAVYCDLCIKINFSVAGLEKIEKDENWKCFVCNKDALKHHRARHWALQNFMKKQEDQMYDKHLSKQELCKMLSVDRSTCCQPQQPKQAKPILKRSSSRSLSQCSSSKVKVTAGPIKRSQRSQSTNLKPTKGRPPTPVPVRKTSIRSDDVPLVSSSILPNNRPIQPSTFFRTSIDECKEITGVMKICQNTAIEMEELLTPDMAPKLKQLYASLKYLQDYSAGLMQKHQENIVKEWDRTKESLDCQELVNYFEK